MFLAALLALVVSAAAAPAQQPANETNDLTLRFAALYLSSGTHPTASLSAASLPIVESLVPANNPPLRQVLGTTTLVLMGNGAAAPLTELALLKRGDSLECWALVNTDEALPIPPQFLDKFPAKASPLPTLTKNGPEYDALSVALVLAAQNTPAAFHASASANRGVTFAMLFRQPAIHRGKVVHVEGKVQWADKLETPPLLKEKGLDNLYEVWILNRADSDTPYCVLLTDLPADLPLGKRINIPVELDGYFLKRRRETEDAVPVKAWHDAPLLAGRSLTVQKSVELMITAPGRATVGAATLLLSGTSLSSAAPLETLALLRHGERAGCWTLVNTDVVRPIAKGTLAKINDGKLPADASGGMEFDALLEVLIQTWYTSPAAFEKAARKDLSFGSLYNDPAQYRGNVVHIEGRLRLVQRWDAPVLAREAGVPEMYEVAIFDDASGDNPYIVFLMDAPEGIPLNQKVDIPVGFDGYFYKKWQYKAQDSVKATDWRLAPLLIGRSLKVQKPTTPKTADGPGGWIVPATAVGVAVLTVGVAVIFFMAYWLRRGDARIQEKLHTVRTSTFAMPPPDDESPPVNEG